MSSPRGLRPGLRTGIAALLASTVPCARLGNRARGAALLLLVALSTTLTACGSGGFQPLYATGGTGPNADAGFASIEFAPIPGRVGQRIRNELIFERNAHGPEQGADKRLEVKITESVLTTLVTISGNSTGQVYQLEANYRLVDTKTQKVLFEGRSLGRASFERNESVYSNIRAREDAENRAARTIASDIRTRLAAQLSRG